MLRIGLTGGIGSGKSTVSKIFTVLGVPVYDSDTSAKILMNSSPELRLGIVGIFGDSAYSGGVLDRGYLSSRVFSDKRLLTRLNSLVHPAVITDFMIWSSAMESMGYPYVVHESAILYESGVSGIMDHVICVSSPLSMRISRTVQRDSVSAESVGMRISNQMDASELALRSDYVINNDETELLIPQVLRLDKLFRDEDRGSGS